MNRKPWLPLVAAVAMLSSGAALAQSDGAEKVAPATQRYIVKFSDYSRGRAEIARVGGAVVLDLPRHSAAAAHLPEHAVTALLANPHIEYVELDPERHLAAQTIPYGISMVQATDSVFATPSGTSRKICVIDSGIYPGHEDLAGVPMTHAPGDPPWNVDGCGHGTHVAGTIVAANNTLGVVGVAPAAVGLHIVRVFGDSCSWTYASNLVAALDSCTDAGSHVVNMSLGGNNPSRTEAAAFNQAFADGVLPVAAAGNAGSPSKSYPASYDSVISVAAIDKDKALASFSQRNDQVELAAPGVGVLSTTPWASDVSLTVGGTSYPGTGMEGSPEGTATGPLADGGLCTSAGNWTGMVVLCQRGSNYFRDKVRNVARGGGVAAAIYNNVEGGFSGTLGNAPASIIAIALSKADGQAARGSVGASATVRNNLIKPGSSYEAWDGTSMSTPHVAGVAALVWSYYPGKTNVQIREALRATAEDLGAAGRDNSFGYGLVRARNAYDWLATH